MATRNQYTPVGGTSVRRDFFTWGPWPDGYDVWIEVRDLRENRSGQVWTAGQHRVVVTGPQPRPRGKTFQGEMAWAQAERYAGDVVAELQRSQR